MFEIFNTPIDYLFHIDMEDESQTRLLKDWNPTNDEVIDSFVILLYLCQLELNARSGRFKKGYWSKLPPEDQLIAEAEADWLRDMIRDLYVAIRAYNLSKIKDSALEDINDSEFIAKMGKEKRQIKTHASIMDQYHERFGHESNVLTEVDFYIRINQYAVAARLMDPSTPTVLNDYTLIRTKVNERTESFELPIPPNQRESKMLRNYRDRVASVAGEMVTASVNMKNELRMAALQFGIPKSRSELLLVDNEIPMPQPASFWGWHQACGIMFRRLKLSEKMRIRRWWGEGDAQFVLTYVPPFLVRTREHMTHGQVTMGNTGDARWSLNSKSKLHARLKSGAIDYGIWQVRTVILGTGGDGKMKSLPVLIDTFDNMEASRIGMHEFALDQLNLDSTLHDICTGNLQHLVMYDSIPYSDYRRLQHTLMNPYVGDMGAGMFVTPLRNDELALPMASLGADLGIYFRFDDMDALDDWCKAYEEEAYTLATQTPSQRRAEHIKILWTRMANTRNPQVYSFQKRGGVNTSFDMSKL